MNKGFYLKLALSNLRRSRKFYAPYLLASVVTVSMCYIIHVHLILLTLFLRF